MSSVSVEKDWFNTTPTMNFSDPTIQHNRVLVVEGEKFYVNSDLLAIHSEYFNSLFNGEFKEKNENEIEIKEVTADAFRNFLMLVYPARMLVTEANYEMLIDVSVRFLAQGVFDKCRLFILDNYDKLDKCNLLEIAIRHNMQDVKEKLTTFFGSSPKKLEDFLECKKGHNAYVHCPTCSGYSWKVRDGTGLVNVSAYLIKNKNRMLTLSPEAKCFVLDAIFKSL